MKQSILLVNNSTETSAQINSAFAVITNAVVQISELNELMATAAEQQTSVINEISQNMESTNMLVEQNVLGIEQSVIAGEEN